MVSELDKNSPPQELETDIQSDDFVQNQEQVELQFLGSLMPANHHHPHDFYRRSSLHNRITLEETQFDSRMQRNREVMSQLSEFFPYKWLVEITSALHRIEPKKLGIRSHEDRVNSYLGFLELYLSFRGLTILDSTLVQLTTSLHVECTKSLVRTWKLKLLRIVPELRDRWIKVRARTHQSALFTTVVHIMNKELVLSGCSTEEVFHIKQSALMIARDFTPTKKAQHIKKPEVWARAICLKALRDVLPDHSHFPFPDLPVNTRKILDHKRWQLDQLIDE